MNADSGRTPKQLAHTYRRIGFWARCSGIDTLEEQLMGLDLDEGLSGYSDASPVVASRETQVVDLPQLSPLERDLICRKWNAPDGDDEEAEARDTARAARVTAARRAHDEARERAALSNANGSITFEPAPGWVGPRIVFSAESTGWRGVCSLCGPIGIAPDPRDAGYGHLRTHPVKRAA